MYRVWDFLTSYGWTLVAGAVLALAWANIAPDSYDAVTGFPLWFGDLAGEDASLWLQRHGAAVGIEELGDVRRVLTVTTLVNQVFMALFLALAAKELWEALVLEHGALRGRGAILPLAAATGAAAVPASIYLALAGWFVPGAAAGWAIPTATDIALAFVIGRAVFGAGHPALRVVLVLAVADDALGFAFLGVTSHWSGTGLRPAWLLVSLAAAVAVWALTGPLPRWLDDGLREGPATMALRRRLALWPYLLAGAVSWFAVARAGLHPALGLLPIVPTLPHTDRAFGIFADAERMLHDPLNRAEQALRYPVGAVLFLFALCNAGAELGSAGALTLVVAAALVIGKPAGVVLGAGVARRLGAGDPALGLREYVAIGAVASASLTMSLLLTNVAALAEEQADAARLGLVGAGLLAALLAWLVAGRRPR